MPYASSKILPIRHHSLTRPESQDSLHTSDLQPFTNFRTLDEQIFLLCCTIDVFHIASSSHGGSRHTGPGPYYVMRRFSEQPATSFFVRKAIRGKPWGQLIADVSKVAMRPIFFFIRDGSFSGGDSVRCVFQVGRESGNSKLSMVKDLTVEAGPESKDSEKWSRRGIRQK